MATHPLSLTDKNRGPSYYAIKTLQGLPLT